MLPLTVPKSPAREESLETGPLRNREVARAQLALLPLRFTRRLDAPRPLAFWHLASLDAPTVAVVWSLSFAWIAGRHLPPWFPVLLALIVWTIYVGDRLLDARSGLRDPGRSRLRARHHFHWRHRRIFVPMGALAACCAAGLVLILMPAVERLQYLILAAVFLAYLGRIHLRHRPQPFVWRVLTKELLVGVLFTLGCAVPTLRLLPGLPGVDRGAVLSTIVFFALLAWLNCSAINAWEARIAWESRIAPESSLFARVKITAWEGSEEKQFEWDGKEPAAQPAIRSLRWILPLKPKLGSPFGPACLLASAGLLGAVSLPAADLRPAILLLAGSLSAILLAGLDCLRIRLTPIALRAMADLVLLAPALFIAVMQVAR
jgi:hypothetical protein